MPLFSSLKSAPISTRVKGKEVAEQIPDDVIEQILMRLPVKSVLRFRCACKTWYSFVSDPKFSKQRQIRTCILIITKQPQEFSTINIESLLSERDDGTAPLPTPTPLFPPREADDNCNTYGCWRCTSQFLGSSNGLICIDQKSDHIPDRRGLILWNPSTRKIKRLPPARRSPAFITGFGYDESVDDYKLVWVRHIRDYDVGETKTELDVYSLKSNTWRIHPPLNISFGRISYVGVLSNGALHWIVDHYRDFSQVSSHCKHIVALDLATEKFRFMAIPPRANTPNMVRSLEGSLCCLYYFYWDVQIDLWVMKEYGVDSSWTKLVSIPYRLNYGYFKVYPVLFSKEDEVVAVINSGVGVKMVKFNLQNRDVEFETLSCVSNKPFLFDAVLHVESLVSLEEEQQQLEVADWKKVEFHPI